MEPAAPGFPDPAAIDGFRVEQRLRTGAQGTIFRVSRDDIAFPAIATGVYGFPREAAAWIAVATAASRGSLTLSEAPCASATS